MHTTFVCLSQMGSHSFSVLLGSRARKGHSFIHPPRRTPFRPHSVDLGTRRAEQAQRGARGGGVEGVIGNLTGLSLTEGSPHAKWCRVFWRTQDRCGAGPGCPQADPAARGSVGLGGRSYKQHTAGLIQRPWL